jgi:hypothetical protein
MSIEQTPSAKETMESNEIALTIQSFCGHEHLSVAHTKDNQLSNPNLEFPLKLFQVKSA